MIDDCDMEIEKQLSLQIAFRNEGVMPNILITKKKPQEKTKYHLTLIPISKKYWV